MNAKLIPYTEVPHHTMLPLQNWMSGFEFKPHVNTRVAVASNDKEVVISLCYVRIEDAFLITAMEINPKASAADKKEAGDVLDLLLESQAQIAGVTKLFIVDGPRSNECKEVRTYEPRITEVKALQALTHAVYLN